MPNRQQLRGYVPRVGAGAAIASEERSVAEPLQLGVLLRPFDNERGEAIVKQICLLLQTSKSSNQSQTLDQLNRLFVSGNG